MGRFKVTVEVDTDREGMGYPWTESNMGELPRHRDDEIPAYAETFGAGPGMQWDFPPFTKVLAVEKVVG